MLDGGVTRSGGGGRRPQREGQLTDDRRFHARGVRRPHGRLDAPSPATVAGHRSVRPDAPHHRRHGHHVARGVHRRADRDPDDPPGRPGDDRPAGRRRRRLVAPGRRPPGAGAAGSRCWPVASCCAARGSDVAYVFAESLVAPDRVPGAISDDLLGAGASLGRVLAAGRLETRRSIVEIVEACADDACGHLGVPRRTALTRRTYTIAFRRRAVAAVTEWLVPGRLSAMSRTSGVGRDSAGRPCRGRLATNPPAPASATSSSPTSKPVATRVRPHCRRHLAASVLNGDLSHRHRWGSRCWNVRPRGTRHGADPRRVAARIAPLSAQRRDTSRRLDLTRGRRTTTARSRRFRPPVTTRPSGHPRSRYREPR